MTDHDQHPLDERKSQILRRIVEGYVRSGEPVGSRTVADETDLGVSAATVRNEMGILEREGYISHPHTSAGRVPTDKGYRYYVDAVSSRVPDSPKVRAEVEEFRRSTITALDDILKQASSLLADLTEYAALAAAPPAGDALVGDLHIGRIAPAKLLVVVVGRVMWHEEVVVDIASDVDTADLSSAQAAARAAIDGATIADATSTITALAPGHEQEAVLDGIAEALRVVALRSGRLYTGGTSSVVLWEPAPNARKVLDLLEGGGVEPLVMEAEPEAMAVRIGRELGIEDIEDLSLIAAGYRFGRRAGALGVLGPMRMDYGTVISTVAQVADALSESLRRLETS